MITICYEALDSSSLSPGKYKMLLTESQALDLHISLNPAIKDTMLEIREYFFDKEGYMGTDVACVTYWDRHHGKH